MSNYIPKTIELEDGYYCVKETGFIPISKNGFIFKNGKPFAGHRSGLRGKYLSNCHSPVHRLVALTFLECPGDPKDFQVNHKDGNTTNNCVGNLEWVSQEENRRHAENMGLIKDNKPMKLKDLETGEVREFFSIGKCASFLGISITIIHFYLKRNRKKPLRKKYVAAYLDEDFPPLTSRDIDRNIGHGREIYVVRKKDGHQMIFENVTSLSKHLNLNRSTVVNKCQKAFQISTPIEYEGYELMYLDFYDNEYVKDLRLASEYFKGDYVFKMPEEAVYRGKPVKVTNMETGDVTEFPNLRKFADFLGKEKSTVRNGMKYNKGYYMGYKVVYLD